MNADQLLTAGGSNGAGAGVSPSELRGFCSRARTAMPPAGQQPLANLRYIYTICCDTALMASSTAQEQLRKACHAEAVDRGAWCDFPLIFD